MCPESPCFWEIRNITIFKLHFLQNSRLVLLYNSSSGCKCVGNIPGSHFVKTFSAPPSHSYWCEQHHKSAVPSMLISVEGGKILSLSSLLIKHFTKTEWCAGALSWWKTQQSVLHFLGRFLLTSSLRRWRMSIYVSLFHTSTISLMQQFL